MRTRVHTHPCAECATPVPCDGDLEGNYDGWPEVICTAYHLNSGSVATIVCEDCADTGGAGSTGRGR